MKINKNTLKKGISVSLSLLILYLGGCNSNVIPTQPNTVVIQELNESYPQDIKDFKKKKLKGFSDYIYYNDVMPTIFEGVKAFNGDYNTYLDVAFQCLYVPDLSSEPESHLSVIADKNVSFSLVQDDSDFEEDKNIILDIINQINNNLGDLVNVLYIEDSSRANRKIYVTDNPEFYRTKDVLGNVKVEVCLSGRIYESDIHIRTFQYYLNRYIDEDKSKLRRYSTFEEELNQSIASPHDQKIINDMLFTESQSLNEAIEYRFPTKKDIAIQRLHLKLNKVNGLKVNDFIEFINSIKNLYNKYGDSLKEYF